jgi:hypothetical protein
MSKNASEPRMNLVTLYHPPWIVGNVLPDIVILPVFIVFPPYFFERFIIRFAMRALNVPKTSNRSG